MNSNTVRKVIAIGVNFSSDQYLNIFICPAKTRKLLHCFELLTLYISLIFCFVIAIHYFPYQLSIWLFPCPLEWRRERIENYRVLVGFALAMTELWSLDPEQRLINFFFFFSFSSFFRPMSL